MIEHTFHNLRPKFEFQPNIESAHRNFFEVKTQNFKVEEPEPAQEPDDIEEDNTSLDGDDLLAEDEEESESSDSDADDEVGQARPSWLNMLTIQIDENNLLSDSEPEIIVTRQEAERDPEAEAEFDRELAKLMADSADSRKFDRKPQFDMPLPMRKGFKDSSLDAEQQETAAPLDPNMMAFSLMTKRGNKQQVRLITFEGFGSADHLDAHNRVTLRLYIRSRYANSTRSRASRTATHQKSGSEL